MSERAMSQRVRMARIRRYAIEENEREERDRIRARAAEGLFENNGFGSSRFGPDLPPVESPVEEWTRDE